MKSVDSINDLNNEGLEAFDVKSEYEKLGVDVKKRGVKYFVEAINNSYPHAFCPIVESRFIPGWGLVLHSDSVGTKPIQVYLNWKAGADFNSFKDLAQDVIAMNVDDIVCVGANPLVFVDYLALNPFKIPKEKLLKVLSRGFKECLSVLRNQGLKLQFAGGETAELPDIARTMDLAGTSLGLVELNKVVSGEEISEGDIIIGLRSGGKSGLERALNSGLMCNGITLARHCLVKREFSEQYPETWDPKAGRYTGSYRPDQYLDELEMTVGEAIASPTRIFAPVVLRVLEEFGEHVKGLVHNTGGGQTKCLRLGRNIHYIKETLKVDPIFHLIQEASGEDWRTMFENYNMGTGFEIIVEKEVAEDVLSLPQSFGLEAGLTGRCEESVGVNRVTISSTWGKFQYP